MKCLFKVIDESDDQREWDNIFMNSYQFNQHLCINSKLFLLEIIAWINRQDGLLKFGNFMQIFFSLNYYFTSLRYYYLLVLTISTQLKSKLSQHLYIYLMPFTFIPLILSVITRISSCKFQGKSSNSVAYFLFGCFS